MSRAESLRRRMDAVSAILLPLKLTLSESGAPRGEQRLFHIQNGETTIYESPRIGRIEAKARELVRQATPRKAPPGYVTLALQNDAREAEINRLRNLVLLGLAVVDDFLPNVGRCALQDYGRLNTFCVEARKLQPPGPVFVVVFMSTNCTYCVHADGCSAATDDDRRARHRITQTFPSIEAAHDWSDRDEWEKRDDEKPVKGCAKFRICPCAKKAAA